MSRPWRTLCCALVFAHAAAFTATSDAERLSRAATFWRFALPVVARYFGTAARLNLRERPREARDAVWDAVHADGAADFRRAVDLLGGFYVKSGQVVASRRDLFPPQYGEALRGLTDFVEPLPARDVRAVVEAELLAPGGLAFDDVFESFDDAPLGAASVAQVVASARSGRARASASLVSFFRERDVHIPRAASRARGSRCTGRR